MLESILIPFFAIFLAEFLDKSQVSIILLSSRTRHHLQLFLGAMLAFLIADGVAILIGSFVTTLIPSLVLKLLTGGIFILFGIITFLRKDKNQEEKKTTVNNAFITSFGIVFLSEWGDKTQLTAGLLATQRNPILVLLGVMAAFTLLSLLAIYAGKLVGRNKNKELLNKLAGITFIILGIIFLL